MRASKVHPSDEENRTQIMQISVKKLDPRAKLPFRANPFDAGADLCALEGGALVHGQRMLVSTGLSLAIPNGYFGRIAPRSGLAVKKGVDILAGTLDSLYRGEVKICVINLGVEPFVWEAGERIAQLIIEKCEAAKFLEVAELDETARGAGGFGSSGKI